MKKLLAVLVTSIAGLIPPTAQAQVAGNSDPWNAEVINGSGIAVNHLRTEGRDVALIHIRNNKPYSQWVTGVSNEEFAVAGCVVPCSERVLLLPRESEAVFRVETSRPGSVEIQFGPTGTSAAVDGGEALIKTALSMAGASPACVGSAAELVFSSSLTLYLELTPVFRRVLAGEDDAWKGALEAIPRALSTIFADASGSLVRSGTACVLEALAASGLVAAAYVTPIAPALAVLHSWPLLQMASAYLELAGDSTGGISTLRVERRAEAESSESAAGSDQSGGAPALVSAAPPNEWIQHLKLREGYVNYVYLDSEGNPTGGVGHLLSPAELAAYPVGSILSDEIIDRWLTNDAQHAYTAARLQAAQMGFGSLGFFVNALASVNFQLGVWGWERDGVEVRNLIARHEFDAAISELETWLWFRQTPVRVRDFQAAIRQLAGVVAEEGGASDLGVGAYAAPEVSVLPDRGTQETSFSILASGMTPGGFYDLTIRDSSNAVVLTDAFRAGSTGAQMRSHDWRWRPGDSLGLYTVEIVDRTSAQLSATTFRIDDPAVTPITVMVTPAAGTTSTWFSISLADLVPNSTYRFEVYDGAGVRQHSATYRASATGAGERTHVWYWQEGETPGTYLVTVAEEGTSRTGEATFVILGQEAALNPQIFLSRGAQTGSAGYYYSVAITGFSPNSSVSLACHDSVDPQGFVTRSLTTNGSGAASSSTLCRSSDGPDHWVTGDGVTSNVVSWGAGSSASVPGVPGSLSVLPGDAQVSLSWSAPSNGGSAILYYHIDMEGPTTAKQVSGTSYTWTGLTNGTTYRFAVRACNAVGCGGWSNWSPYVTPTGGSSVNPRVVVSPSSGGLTTWFDITVSGLTPGGSYLLQIWDGAGVRWWNSLYTATSSGDGERVHRWQWESGETPGTYRVRVTDSTTLEYDEDTFYIG